MPEEKNSCRWPLSHSCIADWTSPSKLNLHLLVAQTDENQMAPGLGNKRVWQDLKLHVLQYHRGGICCVRRGIVLLETDAFGQETPTLAADSWPEMVLQ